MEKKFCVILNPYSGKRKAKQILADVMPLFTQNHHRLSVHETKSLGHAEDFMQQVTLDDYHGIIVVGGDGTIHEVLNGMLQRDDQKQLPCGLIPAGTGNALLHDLNMLDPVIAAQKIIAGQLRYLDIMQIKQQDKIYYAFNVLGWGMPTDIVALAERLRWLGPLRYNIATLINIGVHKKHSCTLHFDNQSMATDLEFMMACNTIHTGKGMKIAPKAQLDDGFLDLVLVKKTTRRRLLQVFPKLFQGEHIHEHEVSYVQVKSFSLHTSQPDLLTVDGELQGQTPISVSILPKKIAIFA